MYVCACVCACVCVLHALVAQVGDVAQDIVMVCGDEVCLAAVSFVALAHSAFTFVFAKN